MIDIALWANTVTTQMTPDGTVAGWAYRVHDSNLRRAAAMRLIFEAMPGAAVRCRLDGDAELLRTTIRTAVRSGIAQYIAVACEPDTKSAPACADTCLIAASAIKGAIPQVDHAEFAILGLLGHALDATMVVLAKWPGNYNVTRFIVNCSNGEVRVSYRTLPSQLWPDDSWRTGFQFTGSINANAYTVTEYSLHHLINNTIHDKVICVGDGVYLCPPLALTMLWHYGPGARLWRPIGGPGETQKGYPAKA